MNKIIKIPLDKIKPSRWGTGIIPVSDDKYDELIKKSQYVIIFTYETLRHRMVLF